MLYIYYERQGIKAKTTTMAMEQQRYAEDTYGQEGASMEEEGEGGNEVR